MNSTKKEEKEGFNYLLVHELKQVQILTSLHPLLQVNIKYSNFTSQYYILTNQRYNKFYDSNQKNIVKII